MNYNTSPFTFLAWKEDEDALVAGTTDESLGYIALLSLDSIDASEIIEFAKSEKGENNWEDELAKNFPRYMHAVSSQHNQECFVKSNKCHVEYVDLVTHEVLEITLNATTEAYNEAVRIEKARAEHEAKVVAEQRASGINEGVKKKKLQPKKGTNDKSHKGKKSLKHTNTDKQKDEDHNINDDKNNKVCSGSDNDNDYDDDDDDGDDDDDEYEDINSEVDDVEDRHSKEFARRNQLMEIVGTQFEAAISLAHELGLSYKEMQEVYKSIANHSQNTEVPTLPTSPEECLQQANDSEVLLYHLNRMADAHNNGMQQCTQQ